MEKATDDGFIWEGSPLVAGAEYWLLPLVGESRPYLQLKTYVGQGDARRGRTAKRCSGPVNSRTGME